MTGQIWYIIWFVSAPLGFIICMIWSCIAEKKSVSKQFEEIQNEHNWANGYMFVLTAMLMCIPLLSWIAMFLPDKEAQ